MAAVWVVVLVLGYASAEPKVVLANSAPPAPEVARALKEQHQMMAQMLDGGTAATATRSPAPRPRSEQRRAELMG
jgi:hypothetical protein